MLDATDIALALTVPCPKTACAAFCGEPCRLYATQQPTEPHPQRLAAAKNASGNTTGGRAK